MLRIPNRQNLLPKLYRTEFSVQKIPTCEQLLHGSLRPLYILARHNCNPSSSAVINDHIPDMHRSSHLHGADLLHAIKDFALRDIRSRLDRCSLDRAALDAYR